MLEVVCAFDVKQSARIYRLYPLYAEEFASVFVLAGGAFLYVSKKCTRKQILFYLKKNMYFEILNLWV